MTVAYLGLGSNLGDRSAMLVSAVEALDWGPVQVTQRSSVYETDPIGGPPGNPDFLNQVVAVETTLQPRDLLTRCIEVETALGRARDLEERWGPRPIDIDLLLFDDVVAREPDCTVPHPLLHERAFMLVPLTEIAPDVEIPGRGSARASLNALPQTGVRIYAARS